jgi:pimeloyl-ACP methyl ester carboxylesterase
MQQIVAGDLEIAYLESGSRRGSPVFLMHGFPYDVHAFDETSQQLAARGCWCIIPYLRGYGPTKFRSVDTMRSGQQAALGADLLALMNALGVSNAILAGYDWGGRAACIVAALWPERVRGLVSCGAGYNIQNIPEAGMPALPEEEYRYWYQYYFHSERGRRGLTINRQSLCKLIWRLWSPTWDFDEETFGRTATAFDNPDFVDIVIHSYRHRFGGVKGDPSLEGIERQLAAQPKIAVPTIVLQGADDGVDPPSEADHYAARFEGRYKRSIIPGIGHNLPQETPTDFAKAILALLD